MITNKINHFVFQLWILFVVIAKVFVFAGCGKTSFSEENASIRFLTDKSIKCTYNINVPGKIVKLSWGTLFDVPGVMPFCGLSEYLKVYIGCGYNSTFLTSFCSTNLYGIPHSIYARDGCIKLVVKTSHSGRFTAQYSSKSSSETFFKSSICLSSRNQYSGSGTIASPNWPQHYKVNNFPRFLGGECDWNIKIGDSNKLIKISVMDVDIYRDSLGTCRKDEKLTIKGKKSVFTSVNKKFGPFCRELPFSLATKFYELEIEMEIEPYRRSGFTNRGFVIGWVSYTDGEASKKTMQWGLIVAGIIFIVVLAIIIFCCYRFCKRRNAAPSSVAQPMLQKQAQYSQQGFVCQHPNAQQPVLGYPQQPVPGYPQQQGVGYPQQQSMAGYPSQHVAPYSQQPVAPYPQQSVAGYPSQHVAPYSQQPVAPYPQQSYPVASQPLMSGPPSQLEEKQAYPSELPPPYPIASMEETSASAPPINSPYPPTR